MSELKIKSYFRLVRIDSSLLVFITLFLPLYVHTSDFYYSFTSAVPLFLATMCTFILNDINDYEKDLVNHPNRPIPSNKIKKLAAISLYFVVLFSSLFWVKIYISDKYVFLYLLFVILLINYDYIVEFFPYLKNIYVAATTIVPIIILSALSPENRPYFHISTSISLFIFGREILMDILDAEGDEKSIPKLIGKKVSFYISFITQFIAIILIALISSTLQQYIAIGTIIFIYITSIFLWKINKERFSIHAMKLSMFIGISYLL